jgi:hypothetical protein
MPSKLFIRFELEEQHIAAPPDFVLLSQLPIAETGQSYLVQAKGLVSLNQDVQITLKLDVVGFFGELLTSQQSTYIEESSGYVQFMLMAAATLPAEGGGSAPGAPRAPGASANLSAKPYWAGLPGDVSVSDIILIALGVDEIVAA